mmetsp:Transcript_12014/g.26008  ORF Transcript_12014/g.26008 Transcript_12014/m.26008 type:complete len:248 (-) Transcript_12014:173-916(-)
MFPKRSLPPNGSSPPLPIGLPSGVSLLQRDAPPWLFRWSSLSSSKMESPRPLPFLTSRSRSGVLGELRRLPVRRRLERQRRRGRHPRERVLHSRGSRRRGSNAGIAMAYMSSSSPSLKRGALLVLAPDGSLRPPVNSVNCLRSSAPLRLYFFWSDEPPSWEPLESERPSFLELGDVFRLCHDSLLLVAFCCFRRRLRRRRRSRTDFWGPPRMDLRYYSAGRSGRRPAKFACIGVACRLPSPPPPPPS